MSYAVTSQLVGDNLPWFTAMAYQQALEKTFSRRPIPFCLKIHVNDFTILVDGSRQVMLFTVDLNGPAHRRRPRQCGEYRRSLGAFASNAGYKSLRTLYTLA
jgi:hypothetical protein